MNFEVNLIFLIKPFSTKTYISWERKALSRFFIMFKVFSMKQITQLFVEVESPTLKVDVRTSFLRCPNRKERAVKFAQIISVIKSETPTLPPHLPKSYISHVSSTVQLDSHLLLSLLASFLKVSWQLFWFYYGQLVEAKNWHLLLLFG